MKHELRELLVHYGQQHTTAESSVIQALELLASPGEPISRDHFVPGHFTVSAFVVDTDRRVLLIFHPKLQRWLQPGGHIDPTDSNPIETARREVLEETGLDDLQLIHEGLIDFDIHDIPAFGVEPAHQHFDLRFLFRADARKAYPQPASHVMQWFSGQDQTIATVESGIISRALDSYALVDVR